MKAGDNMFASYLQESGLWLFNLNSDYWKQWIHERFMTPTYDDTNNMRRGSLSVFNPLDANQHISFSQHICSESYVAEFIDGKGTKEYWLKTNPNNHWFDAAYYASAAGRFMGVELLQQTKIEQDTGKVVAVQVPRQQPKARKQHGTNKRFKDRPGGWVNRRK